MALYSDKVMEHFMNPRNVGEIENPDGMGEVGNPVCGDMMTFYIKVEDGVITDVKFKTFGCGAAIAVSSMVSEMAKGKTLEEALKITNDMVAEELGGLPKNKLHCSNLGADALHAAIKDYMKKHNLTLPEEGEGSGDEDAGEGEKATSSRSEADSPTEAESASGKGEEGALAGSDVAVSDAWVTSSGDAEEISEGGKPSLQKVDGQAESPTHEHILCPYCDEPLEGSTQLLCSHCHISFIECPSCSKIVSEQLQECPHCGAALSA